MNFKSFYIVYYKHRLKKSHFLLKLYIFLILPISYIINKLLYPSIVDLDKLSTKNNNLFKKDLNYLFQYFNSDKGEKLINQYRKPLNNVDTPIDGHCYHEYYESFFSPKKNQQIDFLEIGAFKGNAAAAFFFYFKNANIISCDLLPDLFLYKSKRIKKFQIDNSSEIELKNKILKNDYKFDIIVEDAGHYLKDQIITLFNLFECLKSKGIFVIEELDFPDTRRDMNIFNESPTLKEILISLQNNKDFESKYVSLSQKKYFLENFHEINIFKGAFNEIAFITKK